MKNEQPIVGVRFLHPGAIKKTYNFMNDTNIIFEVGDYVVVMNSNKHPEIVQVQVAHPTNASARKKLLGPYPMRPAGKKSTELPLF